MSTQFVYKEDLMIPQGVDFSYVVTILDKDGDALDLSDIASVSSAMRYSYYTSNGTDLEIDIISAAAGQISIGISAATSNAISPKKYVFDVLGTQTSNGNKVRLLQGLIDLTPKVT